MKIIMPLVAPMYLLTISLSDTFNTMKLFIRFLNMAYPQTRQLNKDKLRLIFLQLHYT